MIKSTQPTDIIEQTKLIKATELLQCHLWHITGRGTKHQNKNEITKKKNEVTRGNSNRIQTIIISSGPSHTVTVKRTCMLFHNIRKTSGIGKRTLKKKQAENERVTTPIGYFTVRKSRGRLLLSFHLCIDFLMSRGVW